VITADDIQRLSVEMGEPVDIIYANRMLQHIHEQRLHGSNDEQRKGSEDNDITDAVTAELGFDEFCRFMSPPEP
jgi:hypothetical protein